MKEKIKSYSFWMTLAGSVVILISAIGKLCGFEIENEIVSNVILAFAGVLVAMGIISKDDNKQIKTIENEKEDNEEKKQ